MLDHVPEVLRPRTPWAPVGIGALATLFVALSLWCAVDAAVWVIVAAGVLIAWAVWIDLESFRLPDALTFPLFGVAMASAALEGQGAFVAAVFGAVLGYCAMRLAGLYMDWRLKTSFMMFGDAKFMAGLGGLAGWENLAPLLLIASVSGLAEGAIRLALGRARTESAIVPFGPHLAIGFTCVWLLGPDVLLSVWPITAR
ncbi:MAG: A24 family peptidase [Pseudomonadota bacterium]